MKKDVLDFLYENGIFSFLDIRFARFISELDINKTKDISLAAALVSRNQRQGHICFDLSNPDLVDTGLVDTALADIDISSLQKSFPEPGTWIKSLSKSPVIGKPGEFKPLVLDNKNRLYLYRYWEYQETLANLLKEKIESRPGIADISLLKKGLNKYFPDNLQKTNWQKIAAFAALTRNFCVISGGPGTGKTTTISKILALIYEQAKENNLRIALTAPTGKAAARLQEAVFSKKDILPSHVQDADIRASTIHRLLGTVHSSPYFRYNAKNPLPLDVLIVDEASMVDLALMSKLVQALDTRTKLILLGDKDQLASVEAGAVLGDICDSGSVNDFSPDFCRELEEICGDVLTCSSPVVNSSNTVDCIVHLQKSYRFSDSGGISLISKEINNGNKENAAEFLTQNKFPDISWKKISSQNPGHDLKDSIISGFKPFLECLNGKPGLDLSSDSSILEIFKNFEKFRILCALRQGPFGVTAVNALAEQFLKSARLINPSQNWYKGRPVLITRNDYPLKLFNGDVGITLPDPLSAGQQRVFFQSESGKFRKINPVRLPEHETVFAMTVHKSQGSEFENLVFLMPDRDAPVLTRELLYTAITRAVKKVEIRCSQKIFSLAVSRSIRRVSGLRDALWDKIQ